MSIVRFFNGGVSYDALMNKPIAEVVKMKEHADYILQREKAEMEKR